MRSNSTSITLLWNIDGADDVTVDLVDGITGTQNGNEYVVTGLAPLDSVSISLYVVPDSYCPPFYSDTVKCFAKDCPEVSVDLSPLDTFICYDGTNQPFVIQNSVNPLGAGVITYSGNGIVDPQTGLFDPSVAGVGTHQIKFEYFEFECPYTKTATIRVIENQSLILW
ncbi:MAG: hypothetical protein R2771_04600 [Saprospiraceae bacterium]